MYLADSGGVVVQIDQSKWILEDYYKEHDYKPSRHKLYVVYNSEVVSLFYKYNIHVVYTITSEHNIVNIIYYYVHWLTSIDY